MRYMSGPPQLKPISNVAINYKAAGDAKVVFDTIGKLAGVTVIYDPDFPARRISVDLNNVTLEQALEDRLHARAKRPGNRSRKT